MAPIHDDYMVAFPACLNVGSQQQMELPSHCEQAPNATYFANQAHYVALLMHHEVVAQEVPEEQLSVASPFHEDYWDDYLTVLEATRIEEQRQDFQGRSPPFDEGPGVNAVLPGESDPGAEPLSATTLMRAANRCRVETDDRLFGVGTTAANYFEQSVDDLKYDFFPVETYGFCGEEEYGNRPHFKQSVDNSKHDFESSLSRPTASSTRRSTATVYMDAILRTESYMLLRSLRHVPWPKKLQSSLTSVEITPLGKTTTSP